MPRELNSDIFGPPEPSAVQPTMSSESLMNEVGYQFKVLRQQFKDIEAKVLKGDHNTLDLAKDTRKGLERLQSGLQMMEEKFKSALQQVGGKMSTLAGKMTERRVQDAKVQELMDRHNHVVMRFDSRLSQMQKIISEQELKLMSYKSTLDELTRRLR